MENNELLDKIKQNIESFINQKTAKSHTLFNEFIGLHPADIADFFEQLSADSFKRLFVLLPQELQLSVFRDFSGKIKVFTLSFLSDEHRSYILSYTPLDELTDLFESLSDEELEMYLPLLSKKDRKKLLSLMQFNPESAGGIMDTDVLTLIDDFTVEKSIHVLQRLQPRRELHRRIYVTNQENKLVGHILLEDLVLKKPDQRVLSFMRPNDLTVPAEEDREEVARKMRHYKLMSVPVVDAEDDFLGVIPGDTLVGIIEQEASEDVYHMSAMPVIKYPYFETSFKKMLFERSSILIVLLFAQSISTMIIQRYEVMLAGFLTYFITMLVSTGGNSSSQTSAVVIQGIASGEINQKNAWRFFKREFIMSLMMAGILGFFAFIRVYYTYGNLIGSVAVSLSLAGIVMVSVILGSMFPLLLRKINIDPAFAAGPFLATLMDILGLLIYCYVSSWILA